MYATPGEMMRGWTRLLRITADNRPGLLLLTLLALVVLCLSAYVMIGLGLAELVRGRGDRLALLLGGMGLMHLLFQVTLFARFYRISGSNPLYALCHLPAVLLTGYLTTLAFVRSWDRRLSWRGTEYQMTGDGRACHAR
jgi:hypothetical protein